MQLESSCPLSHSRTMMMGYQLTDGFASLFLGMGKVTDLLPWSFSFLSAVEDPMFILALMAKVISPAFPQWKWSTVALSFSTNPAAHLKLATDSTWLPQKKASRYQSHLSLTAENKRWECLETQLSRTKQTRLLHPSYNFYRTIWLSN